MRSRLVSVLALLGLVACDPHVGRFIWHVGDSTSSQIGQELEWSASLRPYGDVIIPIARVPTYALGAQLNYFTGRLASASLRVGMPDVALVQLGSNDLFPGYPQYEQVDTDEELDEVLQMFLANVPVGVPILWVMPGPGIPEGRRLRLRAALERAGRPIQAIDLPSTYDCRSDLDGDGVELVENIQVYEADGIHFLGRQGYGGCSAAARLIVEALDAMEQP